MNVLTRRTGLAVALVVAAAACQPSTSHDLTDADLAAVQELWDAIVAADLAANWDATETYLTADFVHLDPRTAPIEGVDAWRAWIDSMEFGEAQGEYTVAEVGGSGDLAYVRWTFASTWTEGGEQVDAEGKGLSLFRRMPDGSWQLSRNVWNANP